MGVAVVYFDDATRPDDDDPSNKVSFPGLSKVLYVVGGQAPKAIRSVECFDFKEEDWNQVAQMSARR